MRRKGPLRVSLSGQHVGLLERNRSGLTVWSPSAEWEENGQHPRLGIAFLRKPGLRTAGTGLPAWFDNLLPEVESALRQRLCIAHGLREADGFGLLRALGSDLSGAVEIVPAECAATDESAEEIQSSEGEEGAETSTGQLRFSLAGMQLKFSMSMANERLSLGASGAGAKWIVKLPSFRFLDLPDVECATMTWARNAGFDVPSHFSLSANELEGVPASWREEAPRAFAVKRFDRRDDGSKIHQEDLCQALELAPLHKYGDSGAQRISLDGALRFVADVAGEESAREMARRIGFVVASGNGDAHLKNWSLLWGNADRPSLTPCYDFVATVSWPDLFGWDLPKGPSLSLGLGGERRFARINSLVLDRHVDRSGCPWAKEEVLSGIERARDAWAASVGNMPEAMRQALETHWQRVPLLAGMLPAM